MSFILRIWAIFALSIKRIISQPGLALATLVGLVIAISLMMSIPLYSDAVYYRLFRENVLNPTKSGEVQIKKNHLPVSYLLFNHDVSGKASNWEDVQPIDQYLTHQASSVIGLPLKYIVRFFKTDTCGLFPADGKTYTATDIPLTWISFQLVSDIEKHIQLNEGTFPRYDPAIPDAPVDVLIGENFAARLGLHVGEQYVTLFKGQLTNGVKTNVQIPVRIAGIWRPINPDESYWFMDQSSYQEELIIPEDTFVKRISPAINNEIYFSSWFMVFDDTNVHYNEAGDLIYRSSLMQQHASELAPNILVEVSPVDALANYRKNSELLTLQLYAFSLPVLGLILAFISLTAGLAVDERRNEIAVLRSRGALVFQLAGMGFLEGLLLGTVALAISIPVSMGIANLIGRARGFLNFSSPVNLNVYLSTSALQFGAAGIILALFSQVTPTLSAAGKTLVTYKQERARMLQRPWWQRAWVDILLLLVFGYGVYVLIKQGSLLIAGNENLGDPLLFLLPTLGVLASTLFFLRIMPLLMSIIGWFASRFNALGLLMAARHLSRTPKFYTTPLMLLILTLSLSAFTASLAQTVNQHLFDSMFYAVGTNMRYKDVGENLSQMSGIIQSSGSSQTSQDNIIGSQWNFLPVSEYLKVPGIKSVTRMGQYVAVADVGGTSAGGEFIGIDRSDFAQTAYWRRDFAPNSLGYLMNQLGLNPDGVLVSRDFMSQHALNVGDTIRIEVRTYGQANQLTMRIVGGFDLFPTWYPSTGSLFVGNLDYLFDMAGGQFPYEVLIKTKPGEDADQLSKRIDNIIRTMSGGWDSADMRIISQQELPERQGLFGLLSVGFVASAILTVVGFMLYALFSFKRRFIEFGVLRANGLSTVQMFSFLAWELAFLILMGGGVGTGLGVGISHFFIPYLQFGNDVAAHVPPYAVQILWNEIFRIYILFGSLFIIALITLLILLYRMKIFQAIKLGETV